MAGNVYYVEEALLADFDWDIWDEPRCGRCQVIPPSTSENELVAALVAFDGWNRERMVVMLLCVACVLQLDVILLDPPYEYPTDDNLEFAA